MSEHESIVKIGGGSFSIASDDRYLEHVGDDFEPHMVKLFRTLIRSRDVVADVGANLGLTTILFGHLAKQVLSFEASPSTYRYLQRNIASAKLRNVILVNKALGSRNAESEITFAPDNRAGGFVSDQTKASEGHRTEVIQIRRLDDILPEVTAEPIGFIKLDVEGYEKFVLEGADKTINRYRPVVVLELNHWCLNAFQRITVPDFFDFLRATFPIAFAVHDDAYLDLHNPSQSYSVMYQHIVQWRYSNLVCAFDPARLNIFKSTFKQG